MKLQNQLQRLAGYVTELGEPPPNCRVGRSLIHKHRWAPCGLFRLFCTCRTCSPKPGPAPFLKVLGQSTSSNHEHGRGSTILFDTSAVRHIIWHHQYSIRLRRRHYRQWAHHWLAWRLSFELALQGHSVNLHCVG